MKWLILFILLLPFALADSDSMTIKVKVPELVLTNTTLTATVQETVIVNSTSLNVSLQFIPATNLTNATITIGYFADNIETTAGVSGLAEINRFITVDVDAQLRQALQNTTLTIYYSDSDLIQSAGAINESALHIYYFNETTNLWVQCGNSGSPCTSTERDETANFLMTNVSHFSSYGAFGSVSSPSQSSGSSSGSGGSGRIVQRQKNEKKDFGDADKKAEEKKEESDVEEKITQEEPVLEKIYEENKEQVQEKVALGFSIFILIALIFFTVGFFFHFHEPGDGKRYFLFTGRKK